MSRRSDPGPYEPVHSLSGAMARRPEATLFSIVASAFVALGALRLVGEPADRRSSDFEARRLRAFVRGLSCVSMSGVLFVSGSDFAASRKG